MFEELKLNENVGALQPDALARIARKDNFLQQPEAYRFRKNASGQFVWITMEFLPCRNCCTQNPWATVWCVRMHRPTRSARSWTSPTATTP